MSGSKPELRWSPMKAQNAPETKETDMAKIRTETNQESKAKVRGTAWQAAILLCAGCAATANGAGIIGITFLNNSTPNGQAITPGQAAEFRTQASTPASASVVPNGYTFTNRFAWMLATRVNADGSLNGAQNAAQVSYDLTFTVEDSLNQGYNLDFAADYRGYNYAAWRSGNGPEGITALGTPLTATLLDSGGSTPLLGLVALSSTATADSTNPVANVLASGSGTHDAGFFSGTRTFTLRFTGFPLLNTLNKIPSDSTGEAAVRFGLDPTIAQLNFADYPGLDGEAASQHGHFVSVRAAFLDPAPAQVPEPGTLGMAVAGTLLLGARLIRSRRA